MDREHRSALEPRTRKLGLIGARDAILLLRDRLNGYGDSTFYRDIKKLKEYGGDDPEIQHARDIFMFAQEAAKTTPTPIPQEVLVHILNTRRSGEGTAWKKEQNMPSRERLVAHILKMRPAYLLLRDLPSETEDGNALLHSLVNRSMLENQELLANAPIDILIRMEETMRILNADLEHSAGGSALPPKAEVKRAEGPALASRELIERVKNRIKQLPQEAQSAHQNELRDMSQKLHSSPSPSFVDVAAWAKRLEAIARRYRD